jgi:hypothetical protein
MDTDTLEELEKLAKPALRHAELVSLAKEKSPNKVYEIAVARWPKRQAKAARSLAQMRRDNPQAFEAFIATIEHARSEWSDTEQAQERKTKMTTQLLNSLDHLSDPIAKLQLAVKHNLKPHVAEMITSFAKVWQVSFYCDDQTGNVLFDTLPDVPRHQGYNSTRPETGVWQKKYHDRLVVIFSKAELNKDISVDLVGLATFLGWKKPQISDFVRSVLTRIVKTKLTQTSWRVLDATADACRRYLKPDEELARATERWVLLSRFRDGRIFDLRRNALPTPQKERPYRRGRTPDWEIREELDPIVDRMLEIGMSLKEIREEFLLWIAEKGKNGGCRYQFMLAVAGSKCFKGDIESTDRCRELLRKHFLPTIKSEGGIFFAARMFTAFQSHDWKMWKSGDGDFFRPRLLDCLAVGQAGAVLQWLLTYWNDIDNFYPEEVLAVGRKAGVDEWQKTTALEWMRVMAKQAVQLAVKAERFGVAAALTQHFAGAATPEKARELIGVALDLEQPVALSWASVVKEVSDDEE